MVIEKKKREREKGRGWEGCKGKKRKEALKISKDYLGLDSSLSFKSKIQSPGKTNKKVYVDLGVSSQV